MRDSAARASAVALPAAGESAAGPPGGQAGNSAREECILLARGGTSVMYPAHRRTPMNADLTLARLAEAATAHDGHAHDRDHGRHCLLPGDAAQAPDAFAAAEERLSDGGYDLSHPVSAQPDAVITPTA